MMMARTLRNVKVVGKTFEQAIETIGNRAEMDGYLKLEKRDCCNDSKESRDWKICLLQRMRI